MADGITLQLSGLDGVLATLQSLPAEVVSKRGGPVKAALRKGALVILKEAKQNLRISVSNNPTYSSGLLEKNLIASRGKAPTGSKGERYLVRVRRKVYPGKSGKSGGGNAVTTLAAANLLEYGSSKQPAEPWLRPAFNSKAQEAIHTVEGELIKGIDRVVAKLASQNKGR